MNFYYLILVLYLYYQVQQTQGKTGHFLPAAVEHFADKNKPYSMLPLNKQPGDLMLNNLFSQKQLLKEACNRLDNCDELLLMRALKKLTNTELSSFISALPMQYANQILIILPKDVTKRVLALGFSDDQVKFDTIRKFIGAIDREVDAAEVISGAAAKLSQRQNTLVSETQEAPAQPVTDNYLPPSIRFLDAFGRIVSNTFRKT